MAACRPQLSLAFKTREGQRKGAGRKPTIPNRPQITHATRPEIKSANPIHVALRLVQGIESLRQRSRYLAVRTALSAGKDRFGFRLIQFSVQTNHLHLICEADDKLSLARGLKGLQIRLARAINKLSARKGRVFSDRYHAHVLRTPREVRNALAYVLLNARKHSSQPARTQHVDPCSSGITFDGWRERVVDTLVSAEATVTARSWLLRVGWRKYAPISVSEIPSAAMLRQ